MSIETQAIAAVAATQAGAAPASGVQVAGHAQSNPAAQAAQGGGHVEQGAGMPSAQAAHAPDAAQFNGMMRPDVATAQPTSAVPTTAHTQEAAFTFTRGPGADGAMAQWRDYGRDLNQRYTSINATRQEMLDSLDKTDVTMTMVKLADFSYFASMTLAEYQMDMSFAQAANGVSHSLLKNQDS
jgi:hypothetical protein